MMPDRKLFFLKKESESDPFCTILQTEREKRKREKIKAIKR